VRSACYLTSEGFYRKRDGDFINFLVWARASLGEAGDQIDDGHECEYFSPAQHAEMITLVKRACGANSGLRRYLEGQQKKRKRNPSQRTAPLRPKPRRARSAAPPPDQEAN